MPQSLSVAVVVPTKNRADDLALTIDSLLCQTVRPKQLVVIDQSATDESMQRVAVLRERSEREVWFELVYIRDVSLSGLTAARNRALKVLNAGIVLFLDDDVVLEPDFLEQIICAFRENPKAIGVSGIITNYSRPGAFSRCWSSLFMLGPFLDDRQPVYWNADRIRKEKPVQVTRLGGGLMAFRTAAIAGISFDEGLTGSCPGEDVEFCARLKRGSVLLISPNARLVHNHSSAARAEEHWLPKHAWTMGYLYHRNWHRDIVKQICFAWLNVGYILAAGLASIRRGSLVPWRDLARARVDSRRSAYSSLSASNGRESCTAD